ncbi:hypothetical protein GH714_023157 [Hevea brasiliensis]|uniref:Helicase C-terminal domain-containing protein n=1 Tax=Hevea brasiliensis TaxID=3981 RepID=A0A6A6MDY1_HEVBR|nr:hypothetical protein GH714_023157 [Hevea brasiliensis]
MEEEKSYLPANSLPYCSARIISSEIVERIGEDSRSVGKLSRSQLSQDQVRYYINEEHNRRRNILQKYIRLCNDAKVTVDTMLLESSETAKAILDLIPVLNITNLVMGTTRRPRTRLLKKKLAKAEFIKKNAPDYCQITIVPDGKKVVDDQKCEGHEVCDQIPSSLEDYVQRIGRTGRAWPRGTAFTFFTNADAKFAGDLIKILKEAGQIVRCCSRG